MDTKSVKCPGCGKPASGKFCNHCGTALSGAVRSSAPAVVSWAALAVASVALVIALMAWLDRGKGALPPPASSAQESAAAAAAFFGKDNPPDLSSMTPRQAADRLFNRVMAASERGDMTEAQQFAPMALQAYEQAGTLDNDARYHVALIHLVAGDSKGARAQVDQLKLAAPNHLLALMVEHELATRAGNKEGAARASRAFLAEHDRELAMQRSEYEDHRGGIERFRKAAQAGGAAKK